MRTSFVLIATLVACGAPPREVPVVGERHVQLLHLDGFRGDSTKALLDSGRLPYLEYLASRGKISFEATTVDKSETMKVIQSYLTSTLDTRVVGWWQFDRSDFRFRNYWLDPAEVLNYALGLEFPVSPTVQDFLAARGENLVAGMSLARRGVPFENYGRAYVEGVAAVADQTYHRQADATMTGFLDIQRRIADEDEPAPALSTLLLAAADEFSHAEGVTVEADEAEHCFDREAMDETVFRLLAEMDGVEDRYFTTTSRRELCVELPRVGEARRAQPDYVLSKLVLDMELGRLVETYRGLRWGPNGQRRFEPTPTIFEDAEVPGDSFFARTLFLVFGDHGMVDTPHGMTEGGALGEGFIEYLNRSLALSSEAGATSLPYDAELGIDYEHLPRRLEDPAAYVQWQSETLRKTTDEAREWARAFVADLRELLRSELHEEYWWLFFLRSLLIDPKLDQTLEPVSEEAVRMLRALYLRGIPEYGERETQANREFFDRHVRLVYGGGARNNAELFLPACDTAGLCSWERRPSYDEIVGYRGGARSETTLLEALRDNPGVGLVFLRKGNETISATSALPEELDIEVQDRDGNKASIGVVRDPTGGELSFRYDTDSSSARDPLGYGAFAGRVGSYHEWNDWTLREHYVNVVGGIGAYLYSRNPAIGDVLLMHADDWNFGENLGGHGGVHRGEKTTFLLVSGPGIERGELRASGDHAPTLLDITPTALDWLGYSVEELDAFAADGFEVYLDSWIRTQRGDILAHLDGMDSVEKAREQAKVENLSLEPLRPRIERLLKFTDARRDETLRSLEPSRALGRVLLLN